MKIDRVASPEGKLVRSVLRDHPRGHNKRLDKVD